MIILFEKHIPKNLLILLAIWASCLMLPSCYCLAPSMIKLVRTSPFSPAMSKQGGKVAKTASAIWRHLGLYVAFFQLSFLSSEATMALKSTLKVQISSRSIFLSLFQGGQNRFKLEIFTSKSIAIAKSLYNESKMDAMASLCTE